MSQSFADYVPAFKALSDVTRLQIIDMLSYKEMCACDILQQFSISQSTLSYHMRILTESALVHAVRDGAWMRYTLNKKKTEEILAYFTDITTEKEEDRLRKHKDKNTDSRCC